MAVVAKIIDVNRGVSATCFNGHGWNNQISLHEGYSYIFFSIHYVTLNNHGRRMSTTTTPSICSEYNFHAVSSMYYHIIVNVTNLNECDMIEAYNNNLVVGRAVVHLNPIPHAEVVFFAKRVILRMKNRLCDELEILSTNNDFSKLFNCA
jgi:hypothetical protein